MKVITIRAEDNETTIEFEGIADPLEAVGLVETAKFLILNGAAPENSRVLSDESSIRHAEPAEIE